MVLCHSPIQRLNPCTALIEKDDRIRLCLGFIRGKNNRLDYARPIISEVFFFWCLTKGEDKDESVGVPPPLVVEERVETNIMDRQRG